MEPGHVLGATSIFSKEFGLSISDAQSGDDKGTWTPDLIMERTARRYQETISRVVYIRDSVLRRTDVTGAFTMQIICQNIFSGRREDCFFRWRIISPLGRV